MADRLFLSNDTVGGGVGYAEQTFCYPCGGTMTEGSVHGAANFSGAVLPMFIAKGNGRILDCFIGVVQPALSASGFVSGTVTATPRINSVAVCSTNPVIKMVGVSSGVVRTSTNNLLSAQLSAGGASAVVNVNSANFSTGDQISFDYNTFSVGSAAAGAAGSGFYIGVTVRYAAV